MNYFKILTLIISLTGASYLSYAQQKQQKPNILFCIADDASFDHFSAYGNKWVRTPVFDRIAREGLLFKNAYTPNAKCGPSRACILTGRNSWQLEEIGNHIAYWPNKYASVMELLKANHYSTGYTGKGWAPGVALPKNGKPRAINGKSYQSITLKAPTTGISSVDYVANFSQFLAESPANQPFFFWFGAYEPHRKYEYGSGLSVGKKDPDSINDLYKFWPDNDSVRTDMLDYAFELEYFDQQLGKMLDLLKKNGMLDNTIIVVTSDNGMPFPRIKGQEYELSNHLPLAIMWPKGIKNPGRVIDDYISFIDFAPTFLEVSGTLPDKAPQNKPQGKSLTAIFNAKNGAKAASQRDFVLLGQERHDVGRPGDVGYPIRGIVKNGLMYLHNYEPSRWPAGNPETGYLNTDGSPTKTVILNRNRKNPGHDKYWQLGFGKRGEEELYDLNIDRECLNNLIADPKYAAAVFKLKTVMVAELKKQGDPRMFGEGYKFDQYEPMKSKNFYELFLKGQKPATGWVNPSDFETDPRIISH